MAHRAWRISVCLAALLAGCSHPVASGPGSSAGVTSTAPAATTAEGTVVRSTATPSATLMAGTSATSGRPTRVPAVSSGSGSSPAASSASPTAPVAADGLIAATLLAALTGVRRIEDDGGVAGDDRFLSVARTVGADGTVLTVNLISYDSAGQARADFAAYAGRAGGRMLTGVGDQAVVNGDVYVRKGSQLLDIGPQPSATLEKAMEHAKETGGTVPQALLDAPGQAAIAAASVLARKLTGQSATGGETYLPNQAVQPCVAATDGLSSTGVIVTATPVISDSPPWLECDYTYLGPHRASGLAVYTVTQAQAGSAPQSSTVTALFAQIVGSTRNGQYTQTRIGPVTMAAQTGGHGEPDFLLAVLPPGQVSHARELPVDQATVAWESGVALRIHALRSNYIVPHDICSSEIRKMYAQLIRENTPAGQYPAYLDPDNAERFDQVVDKIDDWCDKEESER